MTPEQHKKFPIEHAFLAWVQELADEASKISDQKAAKAGKSVPVSLGKLGTLLSLLYRLACCEWGCKGGDHQIEWLLGRVVNQAKCAHRLMRCGFYDEALVLTRGMGEIANLLWLFDKDRALLAEWKTCDRNTRLNKFGPATVRKTLKAIDAKAPLIDDDRYRALCEIGTHPVPAFAPGHYSGSGQPVLGLYYQFAGCALCTNELGFAVAMCAVPVSRLLDIEKELKKQTKDAAVALLRALGSITVLNYNEKIAKSRDGQPCDLPMRDSGAY